MGGCIHLPDCAGLELRWRARDDCCCDGLALLATIQDAHWDWGESSVSNR